MFQTVGFVVVWAWSRPCSSQPLLAVICTLHTLCSDLTRGRVPASPHSLSSKIHKGKVLNDFLSLPVFTACCPHPPRLLPVRQRKSSGIMAELAAGSHCASVFSWSVCMGVGFRWRCTGRSTCTAGQRDKWAVTCWCCTKNVESLVRIVKSDSTSSSHCLTLSFRCSLSSPWTPEPRVLWQLPLWI